MIQLNEIEKNFGPQILFEGLNWHIKRGQRIGLIGPNGAGKTTLIRIITGDLQPDGGSVRIGKSVTIGYLPQEIASLAGTTVRFEARKGLDRVLATQAEYEALGDRLTEASPAEAEALMVEYGECQARLEAMDGFNIEYRVEEVLQGLGFHKSQFDRDCGTLSGGWQMRVALARLLLQQPDVLLLDEPTNHLDLESVQWLEHFLQTFPGSLVFISHDRRFLNRLSSHIAEVAAGGVRTYVGNFDKYLAAAELRRDQQVRQRKNQQRRVEALETFIDRFRYKASKAKQVQSRVKQLGKMEQVVVEAEQQTIRFDLPPPPKSGRVVMTLSNIHQAYGDTVVYRALDVELIRGQKIALVGPNGAGKSTLLKLFAGVVNYQRGERELGFQAKLYYFAQHQIEALDLRNNVLTEAQEAAGDSSPTRVRSLLGAFLFNADDCGKKVEVLSGGEKNRLALAKMLLTPANVLLLDEPTNHLDMASREVLGAALAGYEGTVVIISHDRHFIDEVCDQVWEVVDGRITPFIGSYTNYQARSARGDRPEPLPLNPSQEIIQRRAPKSKPKPARPEPAKPKPALNWGGDDAGVNRRKTKSEKRAAAEARQAQAARVKPLQRRVEQIESRVEALEAKLEALQAEQADPAHYNNSARVQEVGRAVGEAESALEATYTEWEEVAAALEIAKAH